jgi:hypothetical protein
VLSGMASLAAETPSPIQAQVALHLENARRAVASISRADLTELKTLKSAPKGVHEVLACAASVVTGDPSVQSWDEMRKQCAEQQFVDSLRLFDHQQMTAEHRAAVADLCAEDVLKVPAAVKIKKWLSFFSAASLGVCN